MCFDLFCDSTSAMETTRIQVYCPQPEPHVAIAVVDLLQELTDIDTLHESEEGAEVLIDALVSTLVFDYIDDTALSGF